MPGRIILNVRSDGTVFTAPAGGCLTQSTDVLQDSQNNAYTVYPGSQGGQSWVAVASGPLYSITLWIFSASEATLTIRVDDDTDMSSEYLVSFTKVVPANGDYTLTECIIPSVDRPTITATNTYYFYFQTNASVDLQASNADPYAGGSFYWEEATDWVSPTIIAGWDLRFQTKVCD